MMFVFKVVLLCLCISVITAIVQLSPENLPDLFDAKDCIAKTKLNSVEEYRIRNGKYAETQNENCMLTCLWKKANVMTDDGWVLAKNMADFLQVKFEIKDQKMRYVRSVVHQCITEASAEPNQCRVGGYMYKCIGDHRKQMLSEKELQREEELEKHEKELKREEEEAHKKLEKEKN